MFSVPPPAALPAQAGFSFRLLWVSSRVEAMRGPHRKKGRETTMIDPDLGMPVRTAKFSDADWATLAFASAQALCLSPVEQAAVFGHKIANDGELEALKQRFSSGMHEQERATANLLVDINLAVGAMYQVEHRVERWLDCPDADLDGKTPRELLVTGHIQSIERVLGVLEIALGIR